MELTQLAGAGVGAGLSLKAGRSGRRKLTSDWAGVQAGIRRPSVGDDAPVLAKAHQCWARASRVLAREPQCSARAPYVNVLARAGNGSERASLLVRDSMTPVRITGGGRREVGGGRREADVTWERWRERIRATRWRER